MQPLLRSEVVVQRSRFDVLLRLQAARDGTCILCMVYGVRVEEVGTYSERACMWRKDAFWRGYDVMSRTENVIVVVLALFLRASGILLAASVVEPQYVFVR